MIIKEKHIRLCVIILIISNILSGSTILSYYRVPRIWLSGIIGLFFLLRGCNKEFRKSGINKIFLLWLLFLVINAIDSYSRANTLKGLSIFLSIYFLMYVDFKETEINILFKLIRIICMIFAVSIIFAALFTTTFYKMFSPLLAQSLKVLYQEVASGAYSGLVGDRAIAAYFMNIGIGVEVSYYFRKRILDKKNYIFLLIYTIALMMTGKRMLFVIELLIIAAAVFLSEAKGKYAKCILGACILVPIAYVAVNLIPQTQILLQRFYQYSGDDLLNGRQKFWEYCILMFARKPLLGYGFDTFNMAFADEVHYVYKGIVWNMYAHNIYYELLGETGIIGFIIFISMYIYMLRAYYKLFKDKTIIDEYKGILFCGIAFQIIFIVYGFTGNCLYEHEQLLFYFLSIIVYIFVIKSKKSVDKK